MDKVPLAERPLLAFGDQQRLTREDEEVLLIRSQWYMPMGSPGPRTKS